MRATKMHSLKKLYNNWGNVAGLHLKSENVYQMWFIMHTRFELTFRNQNRSWNLFNAVAGLRELKAHRKRTKYQRSEMGDSKRSEISRNHIISCVHSSLLLASSLVGIGPCGCGLWRGGRCWGEWEDVSGVEGWWRECLGIMMLCDGDDEGV